jgi:molecular chaperone GrpE
MTGHHDDGRPEATDTDGERGEAAPAQPVTPQPAADPAVVADDAPEDLAGDADSELERTQRQAAEYLDHLRRLQAEFDNFRKRTLKQQTHAVELAAQPVVSRLLEVLDDFDLALMSAEQQPDFEKFRKGVELVYAKLRDALRAEGLERMEAEGKPFDPEQHEALMQTGEGEGELTVADVLRPGYTLKGRVLRPAGVRVHKG